MQIYRLVQPEGALRNIINLRKNYSKFTLAKAQRREELCLISTLCVPYYSFSCFYNENKQEKGA